MSASVSDVQQDVTDKFAANHQMIWYITDETSRVFAQIQAAGKEIGNIRKGRGVKNPNVRVLMHDKLCGFYSDLPTLVPPDDKSNQSVQALQFMALDQEHLQRAGFTKFPFDPKDTIIFVLRDWEHALMDNPLTVQGLRDFVQANMGSGDFYRDAKGETTRGKRLLVLLTSTDKVPLGIPEIKPINVSLPDRKMLRSLVDDTINPLVDAKKIGQGGDGASKEAIETAKEDVVSALAGLTDQQGLDTVSLAFAKHPTVKRMPDILKIIEQEKATHIGAIPGLSYISKDNITPIDHMVGYDPVIEYVKMCMSISPDEAAKHSVQPLRGMTLAGAPGTGKTTVAMAVAAVAGRILLLWNMGASQGEFVGNSEKAAQQVIQIANSMQAVVLLDDVDKGGMNSATGASNTASEGGPFGRMIQMLLTAMSSKDNTAIWLFTGNRVKNVPPELIRPGRMDERWFVERPNEQTRASILKVHILKRNFDINEKAVIDVADVAKGWTGSELESIVAKAIKKALYEKSKKIDFDYLIKQAQNIVPMAEQEAYKHDIEEMERMCVTWTKCGNIGTGTTSEKEVKSGRAKRSIEA